MQVSYLQLVAEHDKIEQRAQRLLSDLDGSGRTSSELAAQLTRLADNVKDHVNAESALLAHMSEKGVKADWVETWEAGADAFRALQRDWFSFLAKWNVGSIESDRNGFAADARNVLGRLRERVEMETRSFYATALQVGAIALR